MSTSASQPLDSAMGSCIEALACCNLPGQGPHVLMQAMPLSIVHGDVSPYNNDTLHIRLFWDTQQQGNL